MQSLLINKHWTKARQLIPCLFSFTLLPVGLLLSCRFPHRFLHWKWRTQRETLLQRKIERWSEIIRSEGIWVLQLNWEQMINKKRKKKKWGAEEKRGSTLFIKCHQCLRHKVENPEQINSQFKSKIVPLRGKKSPHWGQETTHWDFSECFPATLGSAFLPPGKEFVSINHTSVRDQCHPHGYPMFPLWLLFSHQSCISSALHAQERINSKKNIENKTLPT